MTLFVRWMVRLIIVTISLALAVPVIARALQPLPDYGFSLFSADEWTVSLSEDAIRTIFLWEKRGANVRIEYARLLDNNLDVFEPALTQGVRSYERCQIGNTSLADIVFLAGEGRRLHTRLWIRPMPPGHVLRVIATFGPTVDSQIDAYSARLFPELPSCAAVGIT
jgi:hypothetical protein